MLLVKGTRVAFELADGGEVVVRASSGMLHDPEGTHWPRCSFLVVPYDRAPGLEGESKKAREYFGQNAVILKGQVTPVPRALSAWERWDAVTRIWYTRWGTKYRGPFKHPFGKRGITSILFGKGWAVLYRRGDLLRMQMPKGCILDDRGIVWP